MNISDCLPQPLNGTVEEVAGGCQRKWSQVLQLRNSKDPADRHPLLLVEEFFHGRAHAAECRFEAVVDDTEVKVMSVGPFDALALVHRPLELRVLRGGGEITASG